MAFKEPNDHAFVLDVPPAGLDVVEFWGIGRQEEEVEALAFQGFNTGLDTLRFVDGVVVEDDDDRLGPRVWNERCNEGQEQLGGELAGLDVEGEFVA
ncbi:hypothetical protein D3C87_903690 [compost metagenome]